MTKFKFSSSDFRFPSSIRSKLLLSRSSFVKSGVTNMLLHPRELFPSLSLVLSNLAPPNNWCLFVTESNITLVNLCLPSMGLPSLTNALGSMSLYFITALWIRTCKLQFGNCYTFNNKTNAFLFFFLVKNTKLILNYKICTLTKHWRAT